MKRSLKILTSSILRSANSTVHQRTVFPLVRSTLQSHKPRSQYNPWNIFLSTTTSIKNPGTDSSRKNVGDVFLDNLGNIFFAIIAVIILSLVRSSKGSTNKMSLRDWIEQTSALDPLEMEDLRLVNTEFTPEVFQELLKRTTQRFPNGIASYSDFVTFVKQEMQTMKGDEFTIQQGYLLDRVVTKIIESNHNLATQSVENKVGKLEEQVDLSNALTLNLSLLFVILSLALHGSVQERIHILFDIMQNDKNLIGTVSTDLTHVDESQIIAMVEYLQQTCQLAPDCQIVESETKYPIQEYRIGTALELVAKGKSLKKKDLSFESREGHEKLWTCNDFHHLLRSKSVCAWGECYVKKQSLV